MKDLILNSFPTGSTTRTSNLLSILRQKGVSDRSEEWLRQEMFPDIVAEHFNESVIVRRSYAIEAMLMAMANKKNSESTGLYEIFEGELLVGSIPLGSVGLGKEFPKYLTEEERRLSSMTSRDEESTFGHNCPDYKRVLEKGLNEIVRYSETQLKELQKELEQGTSVEECKRDKIDFYRAVKISSNAVIDYAHKFAILAEEEAHSCIDEVRKNELLEISRVCRKVPAEPATTFHEALQSIWFVHLALQSTMNLMSLGRLDIILDPYYQASLRAGQITREQAIELLECFFVKGAGRLNMTKEFLQTQDHMDFGTGLGTNPIFLDQIASANNFMQNIVIGGVDKNGIDVTNETSYLFLEACANVGTATPSLTVRVHKKTPPSFIQAISKGLKNGNNGLPIVYNDETIIPGFISSGISLEEARDYVVDGCWEPIMNANCDWTFGMVHMLTIIECALNGGCLITSNNPSVLRGQKKSYATYTTSQIRTFDDLLKSVESQIQFFTDKVGLGIYDFYNIEGSVTPTPFFSALLGNCLIKGKDKTWGGADHIIGGLIAIAVPNAANALLGIKKVVFDDKDCSLNELIEILRSDYESKPALRQKILNLPKFGNDIAEVDQYATWLMDTFREAVDATKQLADDIYLKAATSKNYSKIRALRSLAGYEGKSMIERYGEDFDIKFTVGSGTFGQYASMGKGVAASADGRKKNQPVAPNCSPVSGTVEKGLGHILESMNKLGLDRFAAGVVLDICIEPQSDISFLEAILNGFVNKNGNILTVSIAHKEFLEEASRMCYEVQQGNVQVEKLKPYANLSVRVGGWNAPFITLTQEQQADYLERHFK